MFRILGSMILTPLVAVAIALAPSAATAQTAEAAGSPRIVYHPPAPEARSAERPRAREPRRATAHTTQVSHRTPTRAHGARPAHTPPSGGRARR